MLSYILCKVALYSQTKNTEFIGIVSFKFHLEANDKMPIIAMNREHH